MDTRRYTDRTIFRRLLNQARPYWAHIAGLFLLSLLSTPLALLTPLPLKIAVDSVIGSEPVPGFLDWLLPAAAKRSDTTVLVFTIGLLVVIALLSQIQRLGSSFLSNYTGEKLVLGFRAQLFRHAQRISLLFHDAKGTADSIYRVLWDAHSIRSIAMDGVTPFIVGIFTLVSMLYVSFRLDWQLALVAFAVSPCLFLLTWIYRRRLRGQWREVKKLESAAFSVVQEVLPALRVVKAFGQEDREQERFIHHSNEGIWALIRVSLVADGFSLLIGMTIAVGTAFVLFFGVRHVQTGVLTLGELLIVMSYLAQLYGPLETISKKVASLQSQLASAERAISLLDERPDVPERPNARSISRSSGAVAFRNVSFSYGEEKRVLRNVSFEVAAGTRVGIAGRTGGGKTTLMSLLTRFYDPQAGEIFLDGVDLRDYKVADLRSQFALVHQDCVLFSTSVAENIAYARPGASKKEIIESARAANAHEFIVALPEGYDTLVGERGMRLSGGERQRIALARAFLKDAPILILDEPTSFVDILTETAIIEAMEHLMTGRTTFMIAHRLSTLESCDLLLVIENGKLITVTSDVATAVSNAIALGEFETGKVGVET